MKNAIKTGFSFGLTSGIITTLGLIVGLDASTHSKAVVIGGILTIAVADSFSDALGMHISQEAQSESSRSIWESTFSTFFSKLCMALTFVTPFLLLDLSYAIIASVVWGFLILSGYSYFISKQNKENPKEVVGEHLFIGAIVVLATRFIGQVIAHYFG